MNLKIMQIYFQNSQRPFLDSDFIPADNTENINPDWREYHLMRKHYLEAGISSDELVGFMSWKFGSKTLINGKIFKDWIRDNPGYDVYFINPFPHEAYLFRNMWEQGEICHPGITKLTESIFKKSNLEINFDQFHSISQTSYCNFWVGNQLFWKNYFQISETIYEVIKNKLSEGEKKLLYSRADKLTEAPYIPYIFERLLTTLLMQNKEIKWKSWEYTDSLLKQKYHHTYLDKLKVAKRMKESLEKIFSVELDQAFEDYSQLLREHNYLMDQIQKKPLAQSLARVVVERYPHIKTWLKQNL